MELYVIEYWPSGSQPWSLIPRPDFHTCDVASPFEIERLDAYSGRLSTPTYKDGFIYFYTTENLFARRKVKCANELRMIASLTNRLRSLLPLVTRSGRVSAIASTLRTVSSLLLRALSNFPIRMNFEPAIPLLKYLYKRAKNREVVKCARELSHCCGALQFEIPT